MNAQRPAHKRVVVAMTHELGVGTPNALILGYVLRGKHEVGTRDNLLQDIKSD
jgi:hypothetical protein